MLSGCGPAEGARGLTAGPEALPRAAVGAGLRAGVAGAAGGTGGSAVTGGPGNQFLHSLPQQPRLGRAAEPTNSGSTRSQAQDTDCSHLHTGDFFI